jgi:hypothetical protein
MTIEAWGVWGASILLAVTIIAQGLALFEIRGRWGLVAIGASLGATVGLALTLALMVKEQGYWSPFDLWQMALSLALVTLIIHLLLAWRSRTMKPGLLVELVVLILLLMVVVVIRPGGSALHCAQCTFPFQLQWILFLVGAGGATVAGGTALMLALRIRLARRGGGLRLPCRVDFYVSLKQATRLVLAALGSGLVVSVWWAWQTVGTLTSGDPREEWLAITWLVAAASLLAWRLEKRARWWAAGLALVSAVVALFGLLVLLDMRRLLGI